MSDYFTSILDVLPHLPGFAFCKDGNLNFLGCNENFAIAVGFDSIKKTIAKNDFDVTAFTMENNFNNVLDADKEVLESGEAIIGIEEVHLYENKELRMVVTNKFPLLNKHSEIIGLFGIYSPVNNNLKDHQKQLALFQHLTHAPAINNNKIINHELQTRHGKCRITAREFDCLKELLKAKTIKEIARSLQITHHTVKAHIDNVKTKLNCHFKSELINYVSKETNFFEIIL